MLIVLIVLIVLIMLIVLIVLTQNLCLPFNFKQLQIGKNYAVNNRPSLKSYMLLSFTLMQNQN